MMEDRRLSGMPNWETVIRGLRDIDMFIAGRLGCEKAKNFLRTIDEAIVLLKEQPEIVRCKDCSRGEKLPMLQHYPNLTWCNKHSTAHNDDWFCADGKRKDADEVLMEEMDADPLG